MIYYHKFKIITKSVTSSAGGRFSGEGIAEIPFLNYSSIRVNFVGIAVTQSRVVVGGIVESIYNPNSKVIYVTDKPLQEGGGQNPDGQSTPTTPDVINFPGTIAAVTVNDKGEIVVKGADGNETVYKRTKDAKTGKPKETVVADVAGNSYSVDKDGKVKKVINDSTIISNTPNQIDISKLDDFEKLVKNVIDSIYSINIQKKDTVMIIKTRDQKELDDQAEKINSFQEKVLNEETESSINFPEALDKISALDSVVEKGKAYIQKINESLTTLNDFLDNIQSISKEIKQSLDIKQNIGIVEKRRRIFNYINDKIKK